MLKRLPLLLVSLLIGMGCLLCPGCASRHSASVTATPAPTARDDIAEYRQLVLESRQAMNNALAALDQVSASGTNCPPSEIGAYQIEVQDLEVGSISVRAHAQAIVTRGDAYFDTWERHVIQIQDSDTRNLAEERRPLLLEGFHHIKALSAGTLETFHSFLVGMKQVSYVLESNPADIGTDQNQALIATTRAEGVLVQQNLDAIDEELNNLTTIMESIHPNTEH